MRFSGHSAGFAVFLLSQAAALPAMAQAASNAPVEARGTFSLLFENDIFDNTDHDYTNGVELGYTTSPNVTPRWAVEAARALPIFAQSGDVRTRYAIGQSIFTPTDISLANPLLTDRPYAGFLYGAMGLVADDGVHLDQLQLSLGMVGPASLAGNSQNFVHDIIRDREAMGWHYQLRDEPGLILSYERQMKVIAPQSLLGGVLDIEPHIGGAIGNVYDYASVGVMARFGFNLPRDYGPLRIQPSLPGSDYFEPTAPFGAYVFAGVDGRAIARNLFLDGNSFTDSRSVVKKNLVGDLALGAALVFDRFRLAFTHVIRSREYATQDRPDRFGAVDLTMRF